VLIDTRKRSEDEALKIAEQVRTKAAAGTDFAELAKDYSDDPGSKMKGGDVGFFSRNRMVKPFEDAAFAMTEPGQLSAPVKTSFGYHIIKYLERKAGRQRTFEEVKESLITPLRSKFLNEERARFLSQVRNDPAIKLNGEALDRLLAASPSAAAARAAAGEATVKKP